MQHLGWFYCSQEVYKIYFSAFVTFAEKSRLTGLPVPGEIYILHKRVRREKLEI